LPIVVVLLTFLGAVTGPPVLLALALTWLALFVYCWTGEAHDRARIKRWLLSDLDGANRYRRSVAWILGRLQAAARPESLEGRPPPKRFWQRATRYAEFAAATDAAAEATSRDPWGWPVLDFALRLAVAYPALFLLAQWLWFGDEIRFGGILLFEQAPLGPRLVTLCALAIVIGAYSESGWNAASGKLGRPGWTRWGAATAAVAGAVAAAFAVAVAVGHLPSPFVHARQGVLGYAALSALLFGALWTAAVVLSSDPTDVQKMLLLFLGVFPLVNAWFDYVSYAVTLTLVRRGIVRARGWGAALYGAADVGVAAVLFGLLGGTLTAIVALLNRYVAADFYPLAPVFGGAARGDPACFWLYAMIFSTFAPTFAHLVLASFSLVSVVPRGARERAWLAYSAPQDVGRRTFGAACIAAMGAAALVVPVAVGGAAIWTLTTHYGAIGGAYLDFFRGIARALGEPA
jgi:hypothetical protein